MKKTRKMKLSYGTLLIFMVLFAASCKKEEITLQQPDTYFISFKADGIQQEFKKEPVAVTVTPDTSGIYTSILSAFQSGVSSSDIHLSLTLFSRHPHNSPSTFQDPLKAITVGGIKLPQVLITYVDTKGALGYQTLGTITDLIGTPNSTYPNLFADGKVTITEVTNTYIKGIFSGTAFKPDLSGDRRVITDGKFFLPRF